MLEIKAKIEESEKAGSRQESNPGHLWLEPLYFCLITSVIVCYDIARVTGLSYILSTTKGH